MNMIEAVVLFTCDHILTLFGIEGILVTGNQPTLAMRRPKRKFKEGERTQRTSLAGGMTDEPSGRHAGRRREASAPRALLRVLRMSREIK